MSIKNYHKLLKKIATKIHDDQYFIMLNASEEKFCELLASLLNTPFKSKNYKWTGELRAKLLCIRFGLLSYDKHTLEETGKYFNISKERTRQVEAQCLRLLRKQNILEQITK